jgi:hypothetical protein
MSGSFLDESSLQSYYDISVDCDGGDCGLVEWATGISFPCSVELELTAEAVAQAL